MESREMNCRCKEAAVRAYQDLRRLGRSDVVAFENAVAIYRYYHPETSVALASEVVAGWIEPIVSFESMN